MHCLVRPRFIWTDQLETTGTTVNLWQCEKRKFSDPCSQQKSHNNSFSSATTDSCSGNVREFLKIFCVSQNRELSSQIIDVDGNDSVVVFISGIQEIEGGSWSWSAVKCSVIPCEPVVHHFDIHVLVKKDQEKKLTFYKYSKNYVSDV